MHLNKTSDTSDGCFNACKTGNIGTGLFKHRQRLHHSPGPPTPRTRSPWTPYPWTLWTSVFDEILLCLMVIYHNNSLNIDSRGLMVFLL